MNWRFEFSTVYPPPVQAQNTSLARLSTFYESMLESLIDFRVILEIALELVDKIQTKIRTGNLVCCYLLLLCFDDFSFFRFRNRSNRTETEMQAN